jgi:acetolactate synthase small subunit
MFRSLYLSRPWSCCFEGEEEAAKVAAEKTATEKAAAETAAAAGKATFTQDDLNRILAEDRRKHQAQIKEQAEKLEGVLKSSQLTEQDRKVLQENLVSLQGQLRSSEAAAAKEKQELEQAFQAKLVESEKKTQIWEGLYRESTVQRALQDAAVKNDAWQPSQIVTLLKPMTKLVEGVDPVTNRPNGNYEVKVVMLDVNPKTGQQEEMTRTPQDAVARMKELPETYGNLFKSGVVSGIGSSSATGGLMPGKGGQIDVRKLTPAQYREIRAKNPELLGLAPKRR